MAPDAWNPLLVYLFRGGLIDAIKLDVARRIQALADVREKSVAIQDVPAGSEVRIVPEIPGFTVNPVSYSCNWFEDLARVEFRLRAKGEATAAQLDTAVNGEVRLYIESVLVGTIPLSIYITRDAGPVAASLAEIQPYLYTKVFVSYSHKDGKIIDRITAAAATLGPTFIRDQVHLRSGETWDEQLLELIDQSDVFQLYWSANASVSKYVEQEWQHALALNRQHFVRPVYWEQPMPDAPAPLKKLHFSFYAMAGD